MTRKGLPVSTSQAVVGGIIGWTLFTGSNLDSHYFMENCQHLDQRPVLGAVFAAILYKLVRLTLRKSKSI